MKWFNYGGGAVKNDADKVVYRYAYFKFYEIENKNKSVLSAEVEMSAQKYFCFILQIGGDALFSISGNIWNVGFGVSVWGYE